VGSDAACCEEAEVGVALARFVLANHGVCQHTIGRETARIRRDMKILFAPV